jgi:DNA invertase Pin-like site-specific DNA recombinase
MKYGYARVPTEDQTPALQLAALKKAGWKTIFKGDGLSGTSSADLLFRSAGFRRGLGRHDGAG